MAAPFAAAGAAVVGQAAERPFEERVRSVGAGGLPAPDIEEALIALNRPRDVMDPLRFDDLSDQREDTCAEPPVVRGDERAAAEGRIAAAPQVQIAFPEPSGRQLSHAVDACRQPSSRAHLREHRRGRIELLDRGRRPSDRGPFGEQGLFGGHVVDVGAVVGSRPGELALEIGLQARKAARRARGDGGRAQHPHHYPEEQNPGRRNAIQGHSPLECW